MRLKASLFRLSALTLALGLVGCGGGKLAPTVDVTGKIVFPPGLKQADKDTTTITFMPDEGNKAQGGVATITGAGSDFTLKVPPGKYKVTVGIQMYPGEKNAAERNKEFDKLIGKFGPPKPARGSEAATESPLRHEITTAEKQTVTIDLVKGTVSGN